MGRLKTRLRGGGGTTPTPLVPIFSKRNFSSSNFETLLFPSALRADNELQAPFILKFGIRFSFLLLYLPHSNFPPKKMSLSIFESIRSVIVLLKKIQGSCDSSNKNKCK